MKAIGGNKVVIKRVTSLQDKSIREWFISLAYLEEKHICILM